MCIEKDNWKNARLHDKTKAWEEKYELQYVNATYVGIYVGIDPMAKMENFPLQI